jgi:CBS domain-containing protein
MMTVKDIMTTAVVTVKGSATVAEAVKLMKEKTLHGLVVQPRSTADPYGVVSETDIIYKVAAFGHDPKKMRVYEIMTKPCITINPEMGIEYVARLFAQVRIRRAPVTQGTNLLGMISVSDILFKSDFVEHPKRLFLEDLIDVAREEARATCAEKGDTSPDCATAWETVEELQAEAADRRVKC